MIIPGKPLHAETQRHVARMTTRDDQHIHDLDLFIRELVRDGVWDRLTSLCVVAPTAADSLLNLKDGGADSVLIGAPAFVADRGFTTSGTTNLIDTQETAPDGLVVNNMSFGFYGRDNTVVDGVGASLPLGDDGDAGTADYGQIVQSSASGFCICIFPGRSQLVSTPRLYRLCGFFGRSDGSPGVLEVAGLSATFSGALVDATAPESVIIGAAKDTGGGLSSPHPNQYAAWFVGYGMTPTLRTSFKSALTGYLTRRGAAV